MYAGRVKTWYDSRPDEAKRNHLDGADDAGVQLVRQTAALVKRDGRKAKIIAASIRSAREALALAGCDYLLLNDRVIDELNRGAHGAGAGSIVDGVEGASCPVVVGAEVSEAVFEAALKGSPAAEELKLGLEGSAAAEDRLKDFLRERVMPGVGQ